MHCGNAIACYMGLISGFKAGWVAPVKTKDDDR
jgi:hypothetical protein